MTPAIRKALDDWHNSGDEILLRHNEIKLEDALTAWKDGEVKAAMRRLQDVSKKCKDLAHFREVVEELLDG